MKKIILSAILIAGFMVCSQSCGKKTGGTESSSDSTSSQGAQNNSDSGEPMVKPQLAGMSINNLPDDITLSASFTTDDFDWDSSTLNVTLYAEETYDINDIEQLQVGDRILFAGQPVTVKSKEYSDDGILINGGCDKEGITLVAYDEKNCYRSSSLTDDSEYDKLGKVQLPLADNFTIVDAGDNPVPPSKTIRKNFQDYLNNLSSDLREFGEYNTTVSIKDGKIVNITRTWSS